MSEKVSFKPVKPQTLYFPSIDEFAEFMGWGTSARYKLGLFETEIGKLPISKRSMDNLGNRGISPKLARRIIWPIFRFLHKKGLLAQLTWFPKRIRKNDVIHFWISFLKGFEMSDEALDIQLLYAFFEFRNQQYQPVKQFLDSSPPLSKGNQEELRRRFYSIALPRTLLTPNERFTVQNLTQHLDRLKKGESVEQYEVDCLIKWYHDFHLSLFATIDLTILNNFQTKRNYDQGLLTVIFKQQGATYFSKLLTYLKEILQISDYELALHIPIDRDQSKPLSTSLQEAQKSTLQDWRSGLTKPTSQTLVRFYESFWEDYYYFPILVYSKICLALDRQVDKQRIPTVANAFKTTFTAENYSEYFLYYKEKLPVMAASG
ncbi:hypothetical protein ACPV5U_27355 [Vibrio mediterranei]